MAKQTGSGYLAVKLTATVPGVFQNYSVLGTYQTFAEAQAAVDNAYTGAAGEFLFVQGVSYYARPA